MTGSQASKPEKGRKLKIIAVLNTVMISTILLTGCIEEQNNENKYTTFFTNISVDNAQELINNSLNLTIVDCRGCKCSYNKEQIPNAIWDKVPEHFYNTTNDLLIYCQCGETSVEFCEKLVNHTYGAIYNLEGGIDAWKNEGYPIEKG